MIIADEMRHDMVSNAAITDVTTEKTSFCGTKMYLLGGHG